MDKSELYGIEFFKLLRREEIDKLLSGSKMVSITENEQLYSPHDRCECLSLVVSGSLKAVKYMPSGEEQLVKTLGNHEVFGEGMVFSRLFYRVNVVCLQKADVLEIPREILIDSFGNREFLTFFLCEFSRKIDNLSSIIDYLSLRTVKQRIAKYLLDKFAASGESLFKMKDSKQQLAKILGTSREVVSRNLSTLDSEGIIKISGRQIEIMDLKSLENIYMSARI